MFDIFGNLALGLAGAGTAQNILFCFIGCVLGTLIGVLPGIGPTATIAMLLPLTFGLDPLTSLIMLAGIYYGAQYGGSTTSILVNLPGEASSVVTCIDGHQMARQGRAGAALAVAALGSVFAGTVSTIAVAAFGPVLASFAQQIESPDYFSLMVFGLVTAIVLAQGSIIKAVGVILVGLLLGLVGTDINSGVTRLTLDIPAIWDGINFLPFVIGLFGVVEIIRNVESGGSERGTGFAKVDRLWPTREEFAQSWKAVLRGTGLGTILGILPGGGAVLAAFAAYTLEKKVADAPERFGQGAIEGVAGPESANNAAAQTSFIPLLTLGLPSNAIMAMMMGAMMIQGIQPGSAVMTTHPQLFWGLVVSMWIGNAMLVVINLPMIGIWVKLLKVPYRFLFPAILMFCCVGVYATNNSSDQLMLLAVFALFGYLLVLLDCEPAPMVLGFLLGPLMEENLRRSLVLSGGDPMIFLQRPISAALLVMTAIVVALIVLPSFRRTREVAFVED
jgi:TctA family transporter